MFDRFWPAELPRARFASWTLPLLAVSAALFLSGCAPIVAPPAAGTGHAPPPTPATGTSRSAPSSQIRIYTPATTTSIPIILAARSLSADTNAGESTQLTVFSNHSQANTLFLRGDVDILVTGLSVGLGLFKNGAPVQAINCNVSGLTYLVTYGRQVGSLAELKGESLYVPFEGSPIEEVSRFFAGREGLAWKQDIKPVYAASDSALALLKQGKALAVALPEPFVSLAERDPQVHVDFAFRDRWDALTNANSGYPQVCAFVRQDWAQAHPEAIARFNQRVAQAIDAVQRDPAAAALQTQADLKLPQKTLESALGRTVFALHEGDDMAQDIRHYYEVIGKPLDASYGALFYR